MSKELFIAAHEQLVEELMDANPNLTWAQAYEMTADKAHERMISNLADMADRASDIAKGN